MNYAMRLATYKYNLSRKVGHVDKMKGSADHLILTDARAIMAERAVANIMGWKWERNVNGSGQPDFVIDGMNVDVKSTVRDWPTLKIPCYNKGIIKSKMDRFVLVSVSRDDKYVVILGWISKKDAIKKGHLGHRASGFYWEVYRRHLNFMEDW